ncbi:MAG: protease inhibitor I42 family protein [Burkholderiales bacterium]|jgi:inhibitor of cysteine peptidase|nr:protease inhibitor I42 family protein [Burkholderiales bacterium]
MKNLFSVASVAFATALTVTILAGCATKSAEPEKALSLSYGTIATEALNGADIPLEVGQQLQVRLQGNRSTGHQWVQIEPMRGMLLDASPRYEVPLPPEGTEPRPGAGGTEIFSFTASRPGMQALTFEYRRSWETGQEALKKIRYQVIVH